MKGLGKYVGDFGAALFLVTLVYVLVRPNSAAAEMIRNFSAAMAAMVLTATNSKPTGTQPTRPTLST